MNLVITFLSVNALPIFLVIACMGVAVCLGWNRSAR
jgi:hypothetical protein